MEKDRIKTDLRKLRLLIVEDGEDIINIMDKTFKMLVKEIILAKNGEDAYRLYMEKKPDLILTDLRMPIMNGSELIKKIRETDLKTPIFAISAFINDLSVEDKNLANALFEKPIDFIQIVQEIDKYNIKPRDESN